MRSFNMLALAIVIATLVCATPVRAQVSNATPAAAATPAGLLWQHPNPRPEWLGTADGHGQVNLRDAPQFNGPWFPPNGVQSVIPAPPTPAPEVDPRMGFHRFDPEVGVAPEAQCNVPPGQPCVPASQHTDSAHLP